MHHPHRPRISTFMMIKFKVIVLFFITIQHTKSLDLQCPGPEDIVPCTCYHRQYNKGLTMDCSNITSADELRMVFSKDFPTTEFQSLIITFNDRLDTLREGDLGSTSFEEIYLEYSALAEIEDAALLGSRNTLTSLILYGDNFKALPNISAFSKLETLGLTGNSLGKFPALESTSLQYLDLGGNRMTKIPANITRNLPSLSAVLMYCNFIADIEPDAFAGPKNLSIIDLSYGTMTKLPDHEIGLEGSVSKMDLSNNHLTNLSYQAISSVTGELHLEENDLTELPEKVFKPLFEKNKGVHVIVNDNPFECGCDIAWLITNGSFLRHIAQQPTCANGTLFHKLDPVYYKDNC